MVQQNAPVRAKTGGTHISRRSVTRGLAWSVPVVVIATPAPAYANHSVPIIVTQTGVACKHPGEGQNVKSYHFTFCFQNTSVFDATVHLTDMIVNGVSARQGVLPQTILVPAGQTVCKYVDAKDYPNSANGTATLVYNFDINGENTQDSIVVPFAGDAGLPVCGNPSKAPNEPSDPPPHEPDGPIAP